MVSDADLTTQLATRLAGTNVSVVNADGTALPYPDGRFSGATCFTMLHHVPSADLQDRVLAEIRRVLRPGSFLVGVDSLNSPEFQELHVDDICVPVEPHELGARLARAGFTQIEVELSQPEPGRRFRFAARAPSV